LSNPGLATAAQEANARRRAEREARIEDAHFLREVGEHPSRIALRLGVSAEKAARYLCEPLPIPDDDVTVPDDGDPGVVPASDPEHRIARIKGAVADWQRCIAARDAEGIRLLLHRIQDWPAFAVVAGECMSPERTAEVTGRPLRIQQRKEQAA
jgi:hypothetical protein